MSAPGDDGSGPDARSSGPRGDGGDPRTDAGTDDRSSIRSWLTEFRSADSGGLMMIREMGTSAGVVLVIGLLLFAASGVWPPMVAVESGSMEPHMERGDLVFISEEHRFNGEGVHADTGVIPYRTATKTGYRSIGDYGDVIIYQPDGEAGVPIIHRARFWVEKGENWYDEADKDYVRADSCKEMANCPAPHAGFITKGDNRVTNDYYDQVSGISEPVRPSWIEGEARFKIPELGRVRLLFGELVVVTGPTLPARVTGGAARAA